MVCHYSASAIDAQPGNDVFCAAKAMQPRQRQDLAIQAWRETETIRGLAAQHAVSRKFIYRQVDTAKEALQEAFVPEQDDATKVLFHLPVTKQWLEQAFLGLALICHSPLRGISEFCRDLLDYPVSIGKVHDVLQDAVERAAPTTIDKTFRHPHRPRRDFPERATRAGRADVRSTYCYLLNLEQHRVALAVGQIGREFAPHVFIHRLGAGKLVERGAQFVPPRFVGFFPPRETDDAERGRHLLILAEMVKRRNELARGQITARAKNDDGAGFERLAFGTHVAGRRIVG